MSMARRLSHLDRHGAARMVDVSGKPTSVREAIAEGFIDLAPATLRAIGAGGVPKGDVFAAARLAGILAAKRCDDLIPLCHSLPLDAVEVTFDAPEGRSASPRALRIRATARTTARTGVEMEALTAVAVAALTIYDMCKAIDRTMTIHGVRLLRKTKTPPR